MKKEQKEACSFFAWEKKARLPKTHERLDELFQVSLIDFVKTVFARAVDVEDAEQLSVFYDRDDDLRLGSCIARDMPWKQVHILYANRFLLLRGGAAYAFSERDAHACRQSF